MALLATNFPDFTFNEGIADLKAVIAPSLTEVSRKSSLFKAFSPWR